MPRGTDLPIVAQDPWFEGGARAMLEAFVAAAQGLGREPRMYYLTHERATSLRTRRVALRPVRRRGEVGYPSLLPELDAANQLTGGVRIGRALRTSRPAWVVSAAASHGSGALRSGRPYGCWVATALAPEWRSRRARLPRSRRLALAVNAPVLRRLERDVLRGATVLRTISPASADALAEASRVPRARVELLRIPVDIDRFTPEPDSSWEATLERPVVAFVGRADDPRKNLPLLYAAFRAVRARIPGVTLRLVGQPPAVRPPGLPADALDVRGQVASVADALRGATLFALPSLQEGFGLVAAEALAAGLPVVSTPCGGPEELVRGSSGGVVLRSFGPEELAETLAALLADPRRLAGMRSRGRAYVEREHSPDRFRERLAAAVAELDGHA